MKLIVALSLACALAQADGYDVINKAALRGATKNKCIQSGMMRLSFVKKHKKYIEARVYGFGTHILIKGDDIPNRIRHSGIMEVTLTNGLDSTLDIYEECHE